MRILASIFLGVFLTAGNANADDTLTDAQIRMRLVEESIRSYPGNCPCPEFLDAAGRRCGARSAWSRAGGRSVLCYPDDVTDQQVQRYRDSH